MIRDKFYKEILATLSKHSRFESSDFKLDLTKGSGATVVLKITYKLDTRYKITFQIPSSQSVDKEVFGQPYYKFSGNVSPGPLALEETFEFKGENGVHERITIWLNNIWEELISSPFVKELEDQQKQIDEIFKKFNNIKDEYFSTEESEELKSRLTNLENKFKEELEKHLSDKQELETKLKDLSKDIETLKMSVGGLKKPGWLKSFTAKIFKWTVNSENRKLIKDGYVIARQLLPEEYKQALPEL